MTCSLFVPVLLFVIHPSAAFGGRNAGDAVPYGDLCRDTPPGVSGPRHQKKDQVRFSMSLRGRRPHPRVASLGPSGQFTFWQSASPAVLCTARSQRDRKKNGLPRRFAPRNDVFSFRRMTDVWCDGMISPNCASCHCAQSVLIRKACILLKMSKETGITCI